LGNKVEVGPPCRVIFPQIFRLLCPRAVSALLSFPDFELIFLPFEGFFPLSAGILPFLSAGPLLPRVPVPFPLIDIRGPFSRWRAPLRGCWMNIRRPILQSSARLGGVLAPSTFCGLFVAGVEWRSAFLKYAFFNIHFTLNDSRLSRFDAVLDP